MKLETLTRPDRLRVELVNRGCPMAKPCASYLVGLPPQECPYLKPEGKTPECTLKGEKR